MYFLRPWSARPDPTRAPKSSMKIAKKRDPPTRRAAGRKPERGGEKGRGRVGGLSEAVGVRAGAAPRGHLRAAPRRVCVTSRQRQRWARRTRVRAQHRWYHIEIV